MIHLLNALFIGVMWAWHDSFYSKIRTYHTNIGLNLWQQLYELKNGGEIFTTAEFSPEKVYDWSFYAKLLKYAMFLDLQLYALFLIWPEIPPSLIQFLIVFDVFWFFGFDQVHAKFHTKKFMDWPTYLDRHILHRAWQFIERRLK